MVIPAKFKKCFFISCVFLMTVIFILPLIGRLSFHSRRNREELMHVKDIQALLDQNATTFQNSTQKSCYPALSQIHGPCPENMILTPLINNRSLGICYCDYEHHDRLLIYHELSNRCYFIFTQGYCDPGYWLTINNSTDGPSCEKNQCRRSITGNSIVRNTTRTSELVALRDGTCARLGTNANGYCQEDEELRFLKLKVYPECSKKISQKFEDSHAKTNFASVGGVPNADCPPGFFKTKLGLCAVDFEYLHKYNSI